MREPSGDNPPSARAVALAGVGRPRRAQRAAPRRGVAAGAAGDRGGSRAVDRGETDRLPFDGVDPLGVRSVEGAKGAVAARDRAKLVGATGTSGKGANGAGGP